MCIENKRIIYVIVACVSLLILLYVVFSYKTPKLSVSTVEKMTVEAPSHKTDIKQEDIKVTPEFYDAGSGVVMSGPEYIPSQFLSPWYQAYTGNMKNYYLLDDGEGGSAGLQFNQCSKACCSDQWPTPFKMPAESSVCEDKNEFVPNNYTCNNAWQDTGCVCLTKHQAEFIGGRGGNA